MRTSSPGTCSSPALSTGPCSGSRGSTSPEALEDAAGVLEIRQDNEYAAGHLPGAGHIELGALAARVDDLPPRPMVVMCGHSGRAMGAASPLERAGRDDLSVLDGGPKDWADATGRALATGI